MNQRNLLAGKYRSLSPSLPRARVLGARVVLHARRWCSPGRSTTIAAVCPGASPSVTIWDANSPAATRAHAKSWRPAEYHCRTSAASPSSWAAAELCPDWPRTVRRRFDECPWRSSGGSSSCARGAPTNSAHNTRPGVLASPGCPVCAAWSGASSLVRRCL